MDEFELIDAILAVLGDRAAGDWVRVGPGDDSSVVRSTPGHELVSSIDALVEGVHFPVDAPGVLVGYRALMVSLSDLAAMAATPRFALVGLSLPSERGEWALDLAAGMREAAADAGIYVCGGNIARGPLTITVSVHGEAPEGEAITRAGARVGDGIFVSGPLGSAASCVRRGRCRGADPARLDASQRAYFKPRARLDLAETIRGRASAAIDVSDGLLQDLSHLVEASGVAASIASDRVPLGPDATMQDALGGGDDYELLCTAADLPGFTRIGEVRQGSGITVDGTAVQARGYDHFRA